MILTMDKYEIRRLRLIQIRDDMCGGKAVDVARKIEREPSYVSRMLYPEGKPGKKRIADDMVEVIETAFSLPKGWMDGIAEKENSNVSYVGEAKKTKGYPLISWVSAGCWLEAVEPYTLSEIAEWPETDTHVMGDAFWLKVQGDSMTSPSGISIPEGMIILVDTGRQAVNGSLVVAKLTNENEATFKKYVSDAGQQYLKPLNPEYRMQPVDGNCKIIGVVVEAKVRFV